MGKAQSIHKESGDDELQEVKRWFEDKGVCGVQEMMRIKLEGWKDVKVKIGVTGESGVGKSSFINAFMGLDDEDEGAAGTDVVEKTFEPATYSYPGNPNITLVDLPGIGTPTFPDLRTYCKKVGLETYNTFLILTAGRFRQHDLELANKIKKMGKSFFLIRTKIDQDVESENRRRNPDVEAMIKRIQNNCYENVKEFGICEEKIFLISNRCQDKWDFSRLVDAVVQQLPDNQKEALTLSLRILSEDVLKKKVEVLRSQLWRISFLSLVTWPADIVALPFNVICTWLAMAKELSEKLKKNCGLHKEDSDPLETPIPVGLASVPIALSVIGKKAEFFRSQLGLPEENSDEFRSLKPEIQERIRKFYPRDEKGLLKRTLETLLKPLHSGAAPPFQMAAYTLNLLLDEMEALSLDILVETARENENTDQSEDVAILNDD